MGGDASSLLIVVVVVVVVVVVLVVVSRLVLLGSNDNNSRQLTFVLLGYFQMITFLYCQDRFCRECVSRYLSVTIKDKNIKHLVCPKCHEPCNLDDEAVATEYFNNFDIMVKILVVLG